MGEADAARLADRRRETLCAFNALAMASVGGLRRDSQKNHVTEHASLLVSRRVAGRGTSVSTTPDE